MDRATFSRVLAWTPDDEEADKLSTVNIPHRKSPAPWPVIMTVQRLAFQRGEAFAYEAACALTMRRVAA